MEKLEEEFIAKLAENPEDVETRRVYADWLEENGEEDKAIIIRHLDEVVKAIKNTNAEFFKKINKSIEIKCPECKSLAFTVSGTYTIRRPPSITAHCYTCHRPFNFEYIIGNTYTDSYGTWLYWGGLNNKFWEKI